MINEYIIERFDCNVCRRYSLGIINKRLKIPRRYKTFSIGCKHCKTYVVLEFYDEKHKVWYYSAEDLHPGMDINFKVVNVT